MKSQALRRQLFLYQDGIILALTLRAFAALGLLDGPDDAPTLSDSFAGLPASGFAHLRVGLRTLAQAGWIEDGPSMIPEATALLWTERGREALAARQTYVALGNYLARFADPEPDIWSKRWTVEQAADFMTLAEHIASRRLSYPHSCSLIAAHLDGALAAPLLLGLHGRNRLAADIPLIEGDALGRCQMALMQALGWLSPAGRWTSDGRLFSTFVPHLGLTASYLPMLSRLPDLYRGNFSQAPGPIGTGREWHVQRELNIEASTAAHARYFADADALIRSVFDAIPLDAQPSFVLDVGCGDGSWLARVARLVRSDTLRGRNLDRFPLRIVGADYAPAAAERARARLANEGVEALVIMGDIGNPDGLSDALAPHRLDMADALHLHAFVDHDRSFSGAFLNDLPMPLSGAAYIGPAGAALGPAEIEADLTAHLTRWAPYARRHGMITLEAHCVAPFVAARHQGELHSIAFDAYHGYSRQYPVERSAYLGAVRRAGLHPTATGGRCYPSSRPFVAVSLSHLRSSQDDRLAAHVAAPRRGGWAPDVGTDLSDGAALHRLLYHDGDTRYPRPWCAPATNALITRAMTLLEERLENLPDGGTLRVCDYGTGTGLAALELLKACAERSFDSKLAARGGKLELLCVDIPSSWFAMGQALLERYASVEFHALTDARGRFRPLEDITQGRKIDLILCSMVFHLIRPPALARLAGEFAAILSTDGALLWNAPDIGPPGPWSMLFHDANRALRSHWEALLTGAVEPVSPGQREAVANAPRDEFGKARIDRARAGRRILAQPNDAGAVAAALSAHLTGSITTSPHEMYWTEIADVLRVPSNHREYLPEIETDALRLRVIDELAAGNIFPALSQGAASTGNGVTVHWTSGEHRVAQGRP